MFSVTVFYYTVINFSYQIQPITFMVALVIDDIIENLRKKYYNGAHRRASILSAEELARYRISVLLNSKVHIKSSIIQFEHSSNGPNQPMVDLG